MVRELGIDLDRDIWGLGVQEGKKGVEDLGRCLLGTDGTLRVWSGYVCGV